MNNCFFLAEVVIVFKPFTIFAKKRSTVNTELRKQAKNDFEKYFFKLMNNCLFGKQWRM